MAISIGTSGWSYTHWEHVLYPPGIPPYARLGHYIQHYQTVETNSTYYRWPSNSSFASWRRRTPTGFQMSIKAPRGLTHAKQLYAPERWVERIIKGMHELAEKRGVLLVQLPPDLSYDYARLAYFLQQLPSWLRVTCEFRHPSWHNEAIFDLLAQHQVAYCVMSGAHLPCILRATAPFVYLRLHGPDQQYMYAGSYSDTDLHWWAERIWEWQNQGKDVFAYFNNDGHGNAVYNANRLRQILQV